MLVYFLKHKYRSQLVLGIVPDIICFFAEKQGIANVDDKN